MLIYRFRFIRNLFDTSASVLPPGLSSSVSFGSACRGPPGLHQGHGSCAGHSSSAGLPSPALPGRLAPSGTFPSGDSPGEGLPSQFVCLSRHCNQPLKELSCSDPSQGLPGHGDSVGSFEGFPDS